MIKKNRFISISILFLLISCDKFKETKNKEDFSWGTSVTSVKDYPIEVHKGFSSK
ncbi:MAG: hypothetical protein ABI576_09820 [Flavobacterium sp.]